VIDKDPITTRLGAELAKKVVKSGKNVPIRPIWSRVTHRRESVIQQNLKAAGSQRQLAKPRLTFDLNS
jgi:hypothetical protein